MLSLPKGNKFVSSAPNKWRNNPRHCPDNASIHAEVAAIRATKENLKDCTIYIARVNALGELRMSRPCHDCMKMIIDAGIRRICYTNQDGTMSVEKISEFSCGR